jgi:hypothetical protein
MAARDWPPYVLFGGQRDTGRHLVFFHYLFKSYLGA